ncbi:MAG TPA: response regulator [Paracoccaceae bacterium]|nr:response regulator [Paracoccaceae bacterium]
MPTVIPAVADHVPPPSIVPAPRTALAQVPSPDLPLAGLTLLAVEDSRYASDALRLMAQRSGARLRRAGTVAEAARHLRVYRPDAVLLDPGLPDGCGLDLLAASGVQGRGAPPVIVLSGDAGWREAALEAGAAAFLEKPLAGLPAFQSALLAVLPDRAWLAGLAPAQAALPPGDPLALCDDLAAAAGRLAAGPDDRARRYVAGFLGGLARATGDAVLAHAVADLPGQPQAVGAVAARLAERLAQARATGFAAR